MQRILSFEQTPALSVPLRFLLTAPLFGILAALLMLWQGPAMLASRWLPSTLAFTHLLTLGFLSMTMVGALLQILQVVVGVEIRAPRVTAGFVHAALAAGAMLLPLAFLTSEAVLFQLAILCLASGFLWLLLVCGIGLVKVGQATATVTAIRLSLLGLLIAVSLGLAAASAFAWPLALPVIEITHVHAAWGLLAWVGLLTVGVAYQVVPMFQVTPIYPAAMTRWLAWAVATALAAWSISFLLPSQAASWLAMASALALCAAFCAFGFATLRLLYQRKRPPDATTYFWRTSLVCLLAGAAVWLLGRLQPELAAAPAFDLVVGALFIVGFGCTVVNGMLYKIVPFLIWYHLQHHLGEQGRKAPNVRQIITDQAAGHQLRVHVCAVVLLAASPLWPEMLARLAALLLAVSTGWLWFNLLKAARAYHAALAFPSPQTRGGSLAGQVPQSR